jgi:hypothetical protein
LELRTEMPVIAVKAVLATDFTRLARLKPGSIEQLATWTLCREQGPGTLPGQAVGFESLKPVDSDWLQSTGGTEVPPEG